MDKGSDIETHDFMNVESFSQLPFKRPAAPLTNKLDRGGGAVRLFGIEFNGEGGHPDSSSSSDSFSAKLTDVSAMVDTTKDVHEGGGGGGSEGGRKFECHYCCRSFPTSQALGGHQNAHKRERQHAKRAHLQSALAHSSATAGLPPEAHVFGHLVNYRLSSTARPWSSNNTSSVSSFSNISSMTNNNNNNNRYRSGHGNSWAHQQHQVQAPINGSPLGMWRVAPSSSSFNHHHQRSHHHHQMVQPLVGYDSKLVQVGAHNHHHHHNQSISGRVHMYEPTKSAGLQEQVSLDLRL